MLAVTNSRFGLSISLRFHLAFVTAVIATATIVRTSKPTMMMMLRRGNCSMGKEQSTPLSYRSHLELHEFIISQFGWPGTQITTAMENNLELTCQPYSTRKYLNRHHKTSESQICSSSTSEIIRKGGSNLDSYRFMFPSTC